MRAFEVGRVGWNRLGGNLIISGAFGLFRREGMIAAGGYRHGSIAEDMELVATLRRRAYEHGGPGRILFIPDPVAWTKVPDSLRVLARQRSRWHNGLLEVLRRHRRLLFNPRYGTLGMVVAPYYAAVELLAPIIEFVGLVMLATGLIIGAINWPFAFLFFLSPMAGARCSRCSPSAWTSGRTAPAAGWATVCCSSGGRWLRASAIAS
jgi:cellulose synthase/poly-beta-1,6-N-acetylglucosamine synthase-like glycosyltransferase